MNAIRKTAEQFTLSGDRRPRDPRMVELAGKALAAERARKERDDLHRRQTRRILWHLRIDAFCASIVSAFCWVCDLPWRLDRYFENLDFDRIIRNCDVISSALFNLAGFGIVCLVGWGILSIIFDAAIHH